MKVKSKEERKLIVDDIKIMVIEEELRYVQNMVCFNTMYLCTID